MLKGKFFLKILLIQRTHYNKYNCTVWIWLGIWFYLSIVLSHGYKNRITNNFTEYKILYVNIYPIYCPHPYAALGSFLSFYGFTLFVSVCFFISLHSWFLFIPLNGSSILNPICSFISESAKFGDKCVYPCLQLLIHFCRINVVVFPFYVTLSLTI